jgi:hypothetical protein
MVTIHEIKDKGYIPQKTFAMLIIGSGLTLMKTLMLNMRDLKKLRVIHPGEERFIRQPRPYEIPLYHQGMKCGVTEEKYLRPTLYCNPCEHDIVAMAHQLGAFQKSDYEYAKAAFMFVKEKLVLEHVPMDSADETFRRGSGTCLHLITLFIALCRAAGIKARYKMFAMTMVKSWYDALVGADPLVKKWYNTMGYFTLDGEGEVFIDGKWVVAHVGPTAERQAAGGIPITTFGEDAIGLWFYPVPGTIMTMESIPYGMGVMTKLAEKVAPATMERVNISIQKQEVIGRKIIADAGGLAAYDAMARKKLGPEGPSIDLTKPSRILFD